MKVSIVNVARLKNWLDTFRLANTDTQVVTGLADLAVICDDIVRSGPFGWMVRRPSRMSPAEFARFMGTFFPAIMSGTNSAALVSAVQELRESVGSKTGAK